MNPRTAKIIETYYPIAFAITVTGISWHFQPDPDELKALLETAINVGSIIIGFLGTMASILLGTTTRAIAFLKTVRKFSLIVEYIWSAVRWSFSFVAVSVLFQVYSRWWKVPWIYAWVFLGAFASAVTFRAVDIALTVLRSIAVNNR